MNNEDIRLTKEEQNQVLCDFPGIEQTECSVVAFIANTATDKAIKKILDIIGISSYGYDVHDSCQLCGGQACIDTALANELSDILKEMR